MTATNTPIHEAASHLGVSASTLRNWADKTGIAGTRTSNGKRIYSEDDLVVLEAVKSLRDQDAGWQTIRRHIGTGTAPHGEPTDGPGDPVVPSQPFDTGAIIAAVVEAVTAQTDQAERYARATFEIGTLTSDIKHLRAQLEDERDRHARELHDARAERDQARGLLAAPAPRPWWKAWG